MKQQSEVNDTVRLSLYVNSLKKLSEISCWEWDDDSGFELKGGTVGS